MLMLAHPSQTGVSFVRPNSRGVPPAALSQTIGNLVRENLFQRVQLRGMTVGEVERFIEITTEANPTTEIVDAVHSRTDGNPLFVTEVVRLLKQEGSSEKFRLPGSIEE